MIHFFLINFSKIPEPESSVWLCSSAHLTRSLETQNSNQTSRLLFCIFGPSQTPCGVRGKKVLWENSWDMYFKAHSRTDQMFTLFYLKSAFVTGYLSILKGFIFTSLVGDSPSFPSAALVPINIFPPGMFTISSAAGHQEGTCLTQWHGETFSWSSSIHEFKKSGFLTRCCH